MRRRNRKKPQQRMLRKTRESGVVNENGVWAGYTPETNTYLHRYAETQITTLPFSSPCSVIDSDHTVYSDRSRFFFFVRLVWTWIRGIARVIETHVATSGGMQRRGSQDWSCDIQGIGKLFGGHSDNRQ